MTSLNCGHKLSQRSGSLRVAVTTMLFVLTAHFQVASVVASDAPAKPMKVFILAGQSNMQGHAHVRTFDAMRLNPQTKPLLSRMRTSDGSPVVCDNVWISSLGSSAEVKTGPLTAGFGAEARGPKIGPEFMFGIEASELLGEPILIIKTAWGGKSLHTDFRPPSAGPYVFSDDQLAELKRRGKDVDAAMADKEKATGHYYRLMIDHVEAVLKEFPNIVPQANAKNGYELAGFVWFQGWNDMVDRGQYPRRDQPGGYDAYSELLAQFIRDVRSNLNSPELPFVIGVMGVGGPTKDYGPKQKRYLSTHQNFRDAMAAPAKLPEFQDNVTAVLTENYWDMNVVRLRELETAIKAECDELKAAIKNGSISRETGLAKIDEIYRATFSEDELEVLQQSTSNFDFHYMGSAGIVAQIGQAFAQAIVPMVED